MDRIDVSGVNCKVRIGVPDNERQFFQDLVVDVAYEFDFTEAAERDDFALTVDYEAIVKLVRRTAASRSWSLVETLAEQLCRAILEIPRIQAAEVRVRKFPVSLHGIAESVRATVRRRKDSTPPSR